MGIRILHESVARKLGITLTDLENMLDIPIGELPLYNSFRDYHNRLSEKRRIPMCDGTIINVPY